MTDFFIKKLPYDLSSHAGLAFIGKYLKRVNVNALIDPKFPVRPGVQHSALESEYNFEHALPMAASLVHTPLLVRADSGFCSLKLMQSITAQANLVAREMAFIIKWNPRTSPVDAIAAKRVADAATQWVSERAIDKHGNALLLPEYVLESWTTTLPQRFGSAEVIALYCDHATHEQFHSEFKTDMDLERLPSGKFDTNYLVCQLAAVAMNLLRLIGQSTLHEPDAPVRHKAKRRRIKTVMQELMFKAARMIHHAGRWVLGLGEADPAFAVFERHYKQLGAA